MQSANNRRSDYEQPRAESSPPEAHEESLLGMVAALIALIQQAWIDRVSLLKAEARLAVKSMVLISLLISCLALLAVLMGITALCGIAYYALTLGAHWVAVLFGLLIGQGVMMWLALWQIKKLSSVLGLPASREAFTKWLDKEEMDTSRGEQGQ